MNIDSVYENAEAIRAARDTFAMLPVFAEKYLVVACIDVLLSEARSDVRTVALNTLTALQGKLAPEHRDDFEKVVAAIGGDAPAPPLGQMEAAALLSKWLLVGASGLVDIPCEKRGAPTYLSCAARRLPPGEQCDACRISESAALRCLELKTCWQRGLQADQICSGCRRGVACQKVPAGFRSCLLSGRDALCESCQQARNFKAELFAKFDFNLRRLVRDYNATQKPSPGYDYDATYSRMHKLHEATSSPAVRAFARAALFNCSFRPHIPAEIQKPANATVDRLMNDQRFMPEIFIPER